MAGLFEIGFDDLDFHELCDGGNYGCVYRAFWRSRGLEVAVKKVLTLGSEAEVLSLLSHRNIIRFYGAVTAEPNVCVIMEYAEMGSLYSFLARQVNEMLPINHILQWASEIALGMNYLHSEAPVKVVHRDLKSKNIVISRDAVCKICDFGTSRYINSTTKMTLVGTYPWMAPEVIQSFPVSEACDVWSYGVVLWELLTHEVPFKGIESFQVAWMVVENGKRLTIPSSCPAMFRELMENCWMLNPKDRPTFHEILRRIEQMQTDDELSELSVAYLENRKVWTWEIEQSLEELKKLERNLGLREEELHLREKRLKDREKNLEKQFHVVQLESHDVKTWREVDVFQWIKYQLGERHGKSDLGRYADLFLQNNINGCRLLLLSQDDLLAMGIVSRGHIIELYNEIEILKSHNYRLLHFPPLIQSPKPKRISHSSSTQEIKLIASCILHRNSTLENTKWKMILDVYDEVSADESETGIIKHVTFAPKTNPSLVYRVSKSPFYMDKWASGISANMTVECTVTFEDHVKRPKSTKFDHVIDVTSSNTTETSVTLTIAHNSRSTSGVSPQQQRLLHSQSSPMLLKGAWSMRNLENAVPPINATDSRNPQVWSRVVTNEIPGQFPAYQPRFTPVLQVFGSSSTNSTIGTRPVQVSGSLSSGISSISPCISAETSPRVDYDSPAQQSKQEQCIHWQSSSGETPPGTEHRLYLSRTEVTIFRETSQDLLTPDSVFLPYKPNGNIRFSVSGDDEDAEDSAQHNKNDRRGSAPDFKPPLTIAAIASNYLRQHDRSSQTRSSTPTLSNSGNSTLKDDPVNSLTSHIEGLSPVESSTRRASDQGLSQNLFSIVADDRHITGPRTSALSQQKNEDAFPPRRWKKGKRKAAASRPTTMDNLIVHGGNPKWMWQN